MEKSPALIDGLEILEKRLLEKDRIFTVGDAAAITGYRTDEAKQILDRLIAKYDCKLKITEDGDLIYDFGSYPHKRGERTWQEWWHGVKKWCWRVFMFLFKIWIAVTLVVYFVVFLLVLVAFVIAAIAGNKDGDSDSGIGDTIGGFFKVLWEIFESAFSWNTHYSSTHYHVDVHGYSYREYDYVESPLNRNSKSFVASVYDFVFGPERVPINPLANQQEAGAYIRAQEGLIIVPEVIALAGWKAGEAENFLSELVVRYQGEAKISNKSLLYGDFTEFARQKMTSKQETPIVWYWDEYEPAYKLTGNGFWRNFWIVFMCTFNFIASLVVISVQLNPDQSSLNVSAKDVGIFIAFGWVPFIFSVIFFGVPLMRWLNIGFLRKNRRMANVRKRVMRAIYTSEKETLMLKELQSVINQASREKLSEDEISKVMNEMIVDFYGDIDFDGEGQVVYKFTRLREELREIKKMRGGQNTEMGQIVFQTE